MEFKAYSAKSKAVRALTSKGFAAEEIEHLVCCEAGKWGFKVDAQGNPVNKEESEEKDGDLFTAEVTTVQETSAEVVEQAPKINRALAGLVVAPVAPVVASKKKVSADKPEKEQRPTQNGLTQPALGTDCRKIWDALDAYQAKNGKPATAKVSREMAVDLDVNEFTMRTQYSRWRKFHNITGRVTE